MPAVFVHGVPETPAVWEPLLERLERDDVVALRLPGFGGPAPEGFTATKEAYVDWLVAELERIGEPVDLVGHDWGGGFALRIACTRPDLLRSWTSDVAGLLDPDYVWHDTAQLWQTPEVGEQFVDAMAAMPVPDRAAALAGAGVPEPHATVLAEAFDAEMGHCILRLYRSAIQPAMHDWGKDAEAAMLQPGLVLAPSADPYTGSLESVHGVAVRMGAKFVELHGRGHWWMLEDPEHGAAVLQEFWATVP